MNKQKNNNANPELHSDDGKMTNATDKITDRDIEVSNQAPNQANQPTEDMQSELNAPENSEPQAEEVAITELEALKQKLMQSELETKKALAALQNSTRHYEKQQSVTYSRATASLLNQMLPAIDSLNMAVASLAQNATENDELFKGLGLTAKLFDDVLEKIEAKPLAVIGEVLDPQLHQVISMVEDKGEKNRILQILEQGWQIKNQMVRQALVIVSKQPASDTNESGTENKY